MPNDDLNVRIVGSEHALPVEIKASAAIKVSAKESFPVDVLSLPKTEDGLPPALRSDVISVRHGKKGVDAYKVERTHGLWAFLVPVEEDNGDSAAGWYYLPAISAGPWREGAPEPKHKDKSGE